MLTVLKYLCCLTIALFAAIIVAVSGAYLYLAPGLPDAKALREVQLQIPLRIYSADRKFIGEFGENKRNPIKIKDVPPRFIQAFLAAEDHNFYKHHGISIKALARAVSQMITHSKQQTGGSTITMQVAKNYFLSPERTIIRKVTEIFLSIQIERLLTKDEILELYINKIFFGHRAYGIAAAAQVYYGKSVYDLTLAEMAVIAGLPQAPSDNNPISNPKAAIERRNSILRNMQKLRFIQLSEYENAVNQPNTATKHQISTELNAPYISEMARLEMLSLFGESAYTNGYRVITTINSNLQETAQNAVRKGLHNYDFRHGFRPFEQHLDKINDTTKKSVFSKFSMAGDVDVAIVTTLESKKIKAEIRNGSTIEIPWENGMANGRTYISESRFSVPYKQPSDFIKVGDVIRVYQQENAWYISQIPKVESALVSLNPYDGAILSLIGGYGFYNGNFNRATQAKRQIGSNIKPFLYAAGLTNGLTAATLINDSPLVFTNPYTGVVWRPENSDGEYLGPIRIREALYKSRNLVSIRILQRIGIDTGRDFISRFGFKKKELPKELSIALGSASFTPLEVATGYAAFANGGYKINPYLIKTVYDRYDNIVYEANPEVVCNPCGPEEIGYADQAESAQNNKEADSLEDLLNEDNTDKSLEKTKTVVTDDANSIEDILNEKKTQKPIKYAERIMDAKVAFIIGDILKDTVKKGTAVRARELNRPDIAGKTGTTNGPTDVWFSGFNPEIITTVWVGFDDNRPLGKTEFGSTAALPIWMDFMRVALQDKPVINREPPLGIVNVLINATTGNRALPDQENTMFEYIQEDLLPNFDSGSGETESKPAESSGGIEGIF